LVERQVRIELLHREALAKGVPERADAKVRIRARQDAMLAQDWLEHHVNREVSLDPAMIEMELNRRVLPSQHAETRRFSHIFLRAGENDGDAVAKARATMAGIQQALAEGTSFAELARRHSDSITARGGGRVGWTLREKLSPDLAELIFAMREGQTSDVL